MIETDAAVLVAIDEPLRLTRLRIPDLQPGQVRVQVAYTGICHSQLLEIHGKRGPDRFLPHTLGHEGSGIVAAVAPNVTKVRPGDRVVLSWIRGSGADVPSTVYDSELGRVNSGAISTFMRETVTCESRVTSIPDAMPLSEAALLGCAIPTGAGIVLNTAGVTRGQSVAVLGVGGVGLSAVIGASLVGASPIIAVDVRARKLDDARAVGATHVVDASKEDPREAILRITQTVGVDCAIEAAGRRETMELALAVARENGGLCVIAGNLAVGERFSVDPMALIRGKRLVGTWGGGADPDRDIPRFVQLFLAGRLPLTTLISQTYPFEDINRALDALESGTVARALVEC